MFFISRKLEILDMGDDVIAVAEELSYFMNAFYGLLGDSVIYVLNFDYFKEIIFHTILNSLNIMINKKLSKSNKINQISLLINF